MRPGRGRTLEATLVLAVIGCFAIFLAVSVALPVYLAFVKAADNIAAVTQTR